MESFYFWFVPTSSTFKVFTLEHGFLISFLILFFLSIIFCLIYYLILGRTTDRYSKVGTWLIFGLINMLVIFLATLSILAFGLGESISLSEINIDYWLFSVVNGIIYGFIFYFIISIFINNLSRYSKYIPFNLFK